MQVHGQARLDGNTLIIERNLLNGHVVTKKYRVEKISQDSVIADPSVRLHGTDGKVYDLGIADGFAFCDCRDFLGRRENRDPAGCKHLRACKACGLLRTQ